MSGTVWEKPINWNTSGKTAKEIKLEADLAASEERERVLEAEKEGWMETAAQHLRNEDYYRGLVQGIGKNFGADAYISEDGSIQQDILCAKVPYLVMQMNERLWEVLIEFATAQDKITKLQNLLDGSPESYIRQLKERIEGHIEENEMLKERERVLREAAEEILPVTEDSWQRRQLKAALAWKEE